MMIWELAAFVMVLAGLGVLAYVRLARRACRAADRFESLRAFFEAECQHSVGLANEVVGLRADVFAVNRRADTIATLARLNPDRERVEALETSLAELVELRDNLRRVAQHNRALLKQPAANA